MWKVRVESEVTTLRLWPLMTLLSRTADELYRLDCDGVLMSDSESTGRVSCLLHTSLSLCTVKLWAVVFCSSACHSSPGAEGGPVCNHMSPNFDS